VPVTVPPTVPTDGTPSQILQDNPDQFGTFWGWIVDAGLDDDIDAAGATLTVFAPTNTALEGLGAPTDPDELADLVRQYIVDESLSTAMIFDGQRTEIPAQNGTIPVDQANLTVGGATIVHPDLEATGDPSGFVHGIDQLFVP
jgi:uncharacterized surface protein with fasciclin (FAS1) repeats